MRRNILHLGVGKDWEEIYERRDREHDHLIFVDKSLGSEVSKYGPDIHTCGIIEYLEGYNRKDIDSVVAQRVFEHFDYKDLPYLLYSIWLICRPEATLSITVPDFNLVSEEVKTLNAEKMKAQVFNNMMIQCHTEVFNEPSDPHRSIWTKNLAEYYLTLEDYWSVNSIDHMTLDGRPWYLYILATAIK